MKIVLLLQHLQRYERTEHPHATCYNILEFSHYQIIGKYICRVLLVNYTNDRIEATTWQSWHHELKLVRQLQQAASLFFVKSRCDLRFSSFTYDGGPACNRLHISCIYWINPKCPCVKSHMNCSQGPFYPTCIVLQAAAIYGSRLYKDKDKQTIPGFFVWWW